MQITERTSSPLRRQPLRIGAFKQDAENVRALERVRAWTRECLELSQGDTIIVSEVACTVPGCSPIETIIAFWIGKKRHLFKVFKPVDQVVIEDLPPAWLKDVLYASEETNLSCC